MSVKNVFKYFKSKDTSKPEVSGLPADHLYKGLFNVVLKTSAKITETFGNFVSHWTSCYYSLSV